LSYGRKLCHKKHLRFSDHKPSFWHDNRNNYLQCSYVVEGSVRKVKSPCRQCPGANR